MIQKLRLKNFGIHRNREFHFTQGINAIIGKNGSGKSSILNAIGIALFNAYPMLSNFITYGEDESSIDLRFLHEGVSYHLHRSIGKSSQCFLKYSDGDIRGAKEVYSFLSVLLDIELKPYFVNVMRIKSNSITHPFIIDSSKRKVIFDDILGISKYNDIWEALRTPIKLYEETIREIDKKIYYESGKLSNESKLVEELYRLDLETKRYKELQIEYDNNKDRINTLSNLNNEVSSLKRDLARYEQFKKELDTRLTTINDNYCYVCGSPLETEQRDVLKTNTLSKLSEIETKINSIKSIIVSKATEIALIGKVDVYENYSIQIAVNEKRINDLTVQIELLDKTLLSNLNQHKELQLNRLDTLSKIRDGFKKIPAYLSEVSTARISRAASETLSTLMDRGVIVTLDSEYNLKFEFDNSILDFNQLSDGQQILASLAIRLSIVKLFSDFGLVFLDEPTINLDVVSRELLADNIHNIQFNQVFLITHDDFFQNNYNNIINL